MRDLLPEEMALYRFAEEGFARVCGDWGYAEIRTPTIEYLHLFTAAGTLSPQMLGRVYSFLDWDGWSGERVVLRPDATIPAARLYVENLRPGDAARFFYVQNVFRFSSGDDSREDWQCGVELIGNPAPAGDVELVLLARAVLQALGLGPVEVGLAHAGLIRAVLARTGLAPAEQVASYDRLLDGDLSVLGEIEARLPDLKAPLRLLLDARGGAAEYLANLRNAFVPAIPTIGAPLDELVAVSETLDRLDCPHEIKPALVRNFEYYTGPVFEFRAAGNRLGGGGRYDGLIALVGGDSVPASGFALSMQEVVSHLPPASSPQTLENAWLVKAASARPAALAGAFAATERLRSTGRPASMAPASGESAEYRWELTVGFPEERLAYVLLDRRSGKTTNCSTLEDALSASKEAGDD
jgi:histidyl-tRNA synthetase